MKRIKVTQSHLQYIHHLSEKRMKQLGQGAYARVYKHPTDSNTVVKIFKQEDQSYLKYIKWCEKNQSNPYVPKIKGDIIECTYNYSLEDRQFHRLKKDVYYIVFLEKLTELSYEETKMNHYSSVISSLFGHTVLKQIEKSYDPVHNYYKWKQPFDHIEKSINRFKTNHHLKAWFDFIKNNFSAHNFDLHENNIMMRGFQPVFTDAVC